jgi:hypothetical protein
MPFVRPSCHLGLQRLFHQAGDFLLRLQQYTPQRLRDLNDGRARRTANAQSLESDGDRFAFLKVRSQTRHATLRTCEWQLHDTDGLRANDQAQRPPPETPGRLQQSLTNYLNRPTAQRGGGSLQRSG